MISLSSSELSLPPLLQKEWLVSNGLGGYASSTTIGMNTRKYHGLLVAPVKGLSERTILVSKLEEMVKIAGLEYAISTNEYQGAVFPQGYKAQIGFSFGGHPCFEYSCGSAKIEKSVRMVHGKNAMVASYRLSAGKEAELTIRPFLSMRPIHFDPSAEDKSIVFFYDRFGFDVETPDLRVCSSMGGFVPSPNNYRKMIYSVERERGYFFTETLFCPGEFNTVLHKGEEIHVCASLERMAPSEALEILDRQEMRFSHLADVYHRSGGFDRTDFGDALLRAADTFIVRTGKHSGIIAGFHWFSEWGRDAMIALPGLLLSTGRYALAREILVSQCRLLGNGLLPNFVDERGEPHYNSADASLWFLSAVRQYVEHTGDEEFVRERLWAGMKSIVSEYVRGNHLVSMDSDCLLHVRSPSATWMDANVCGHAVTPRKGKPVEINALWHSNLRFMNRLANKFNDRRTAEITLRVGEGASESFQKFLSAEDGRLLDVIEPNDATIRPNQIFAVSLPDSPLNSLQKRHVFNVVRSRLYSQLGLRTLSADDPRYQEEYSGNQENRDAAYHQGMIWPWLLGAFYDAQLEVWPGSELRVLSALRPFADAMREGCVGTLPEMYEPKGGKPAGAVSQAWSVAEILRVYTKVKKALNSPSAQTKGQFARTVWTKPII